MCQQSKVQYCSNGNILFLIVNYSHIDMFNLPLSIMLSFHVKVLVMNKLQSIERDGVMGEYQQSSLREENTPTRSEQQCRCESMSSNPFLSNIRTQELNPNTPGAYIFFSRNNTT